MLISNYPFIKNQQGLALLVFVISIALTATVYYLSSISIVKIHTDNTQKTLKALKQAKRDLLSYAMGYNDVGNLSQGPGNFPCPDDTLDGVSDIGVGVVTPGCNSSGPGTMGRYPWKTIGTKKYIDADGELLWYAVSSNFTNQADQNINSSTIGSINIRKNDGVLPALYDGTSNDAVVAVIFSPGKPLIRDDGIVQKRSTLAEKNDPRNYLDIAYTEDNADFNNSTTDGFVLGEVRDGSGDVIVNDLMVVITHSEIMSLLRAKVGDVINNLINDYFTACGVYPEASAFDPTKTSFNSAGLKEGHLPLNNASPYTWGAVCPSGVVPTPPTWLVDEGWAATTYYAFAYDNSSPGSSCGSVTNPCMTVNNSTGSLSNVEALIMFSGRDTTAGNRPSNMMADYYEGENNNLDNIYDATEPEDYIKVIAP